MTAERDADQRPSPPRRQTPEERRNTLLRIGAVAIAYVLYRVFAARGLVAGLLVGAGALVLLYSAVWWFTTAPAHRTGKHAALGVLGGVVLIAAGALKFAGIF